MHRHRAALFSVVGVLGLAAHLSAPHPLARNAAWTLTLVATAAAILIGVRTHRPTGARAWHLLAASTSLLAMANLASPVNWPGHDTTWLVGLGVLVGYPLVGVAAVRFARAQSRGQDRGPAIDAAITTIALVSVLWEPLAAQIRAGGAFDPAHAGTILLLTACSAWVAGMTVRFFLAGGHRVPSGWLLLLSSACGGVGAAVLAWHPLGATEFPAATSTAWASSLVMLGAAALLPGMRALTEHGDVQSAHTITRTLLPAAALVVPPLGMVLREITGSPSSIVSSASALLIAILVVSRFANLVADRERTHALVAHRSLHDPLTGLANRVLFERRLQEHMDGRSQQDGKDAAVAFLDLDGFKSINDTHGHAAGDAVLVHVAARLRDTCRPTDTIARFAGDEFVLLLVDLDPASVTAVAERLREAAATPLQLDGVRLAVDASVGLALTSVVGTDPQGLLTAADRAMYVAKGAGRGRVQTVPVAE